MARARKLRFLLFVTVRRCCRLGQRKITNGLERGIQARIQATWAAGYSPAPVLSADVAEVDWADDHAVAVVMAANGYPGTYTKGSLIKGLDALPESSFEMCFHAGTRG